MNLITTAIHAKRTLLFTYDDERREVEPYCYGVSGEGHALLRAWQAGKGWRLFRVDKIHSLSEGMHTFRVRQDYERNDSAMQSVYACI